RETTAKEPQSPRPDLGAREAGRSRCLFSSAGSSEKRTRPASSAVPAAAPLSPGGRAQPAEGRADTAGSEAASAGVGGERFAAVSSDTPSPDARRTSRERTGPWNRLSPKRKSQGPGRRPTHSRSPTRLLALPAFLSGVV
ncbi:hypothetical protein LEMLEM_LOCUS21386, partial [Lemmus lemmus]